MAQNETSVSGDVVFQDGDDLSETNLSRQAAKSNLTDYVERGLGLNVDGAAGTVDIGSGHAIIQDGAQAYDLFPNQQTGISLPGSGANYIYVAIQPGTDDDVYYHIDEDQSPPADPAILIGTADAGAGTSAVLNRRPDQEIGDADIERLVSGLDANGQDINNAGSVSTGKADITNESYVELDRNADSSSVSSSTWASIFDTVAEDNLNEVNGSFEFSPSESGKYGVFCDARVENESDGDLLQVRLRNVSDGLTLQETRLEVGGADFSTNVQIQWAGTLDNAKNYALEVRDNDSPFIIKTASTHGHIIRSVVHP